MSLIFRLKSYLLTLHNMNLVVPDNISFEDAIALTQELIAKLESMSEIDKEKIVSSLAMSENGARGFFVTYLTSDNLIVDKSSVGIINGLQKSPQIVGELLVKNVAMSTAMKISHQRNNNQEMAQKSSQVSQRSLALINQLSLPEIDSKIQQLKDTIATGEGIYQQFFTRQQYDAEQKEAIDRVLS